LQFFVKTPNATWGAKTAAQEREPQAEQKRKNFLPAFLVYSRK
jgi:hypothetical protein